MQVVSGIDEVWQSNCLTWEEMLSDTVPEPGFIVENIIPRKGVTLITGEGGIGKSFLLMELAWSVASPQPHLDRFSTIQGPVLYIDLENDNSDWRQACSSFLCTSSAVAGLTITAASKEHNRQV